MVNIGALKAEQEKIGRQISTENAIEKENIRYVAGFDTAFFDGKIVCAAVVFNIRSMEIVEKKFSVSEAPMKYIPGLLAFREGPAIMQTYYDLEYEPDILMIVGHGIAHPLRCGLASYVGFELAKPSIGVAKSLLVGERRDDDIVIDDEVVGRFVKTREHANPVLVSPGHMIDVGLAAELVKLLVVPPHKLPEPLHRAHRIASKVAKGVIPLEKKEEELVDAS